MTTEVDDLITQYGIDRNRIPQHVAIIMDGNGRWANKRLMPRNFGHKQGQKQLKKTLINCVKIGVKVLTVYAFSTENWRRPEEEVHFLLKYLKKSIVEEIDELIQEGVCLKFLGDLKEFDQKLLDMIETAEQRTKDNTTIQLNVMLNYGGRREIIDAVKGYFDAGNSIETLSEDDLSAQMYTSSVSDPDVLIRTGGDVRISNFMLWQCAYSELFFIETFWPDFEMEDLLKIIQQFQSRDRRFGGLS